MGNRAHKIHGAIRTPGQPWSATCKFAGNTATSSASKPHAAARRNRFTSNPTPPATSAAPAILSNVSGHGTQGGIIAR